MLNLSLNKLKQIAKMRRIKGNNNKSKERLLSFLSEIERFLKPKKKEIRKNL